MTNHIAAVWIAISMVCLIVPGFAQDPLPSWNDTAPKKAIVSFVEKVTKEGSPDFVPAPARIATFDNDGTLWCEQPMYFQGLFVFERVKAMVTQHPEWHEKEPFASVIKGDIKGALVGGEKALTELLMATHAGMTSDEYTQTVADWLATARHPKFNRPYTELVYQPMLELLAYLRTNGFKTFIVSGGGAEFIRVFAERTYGVPPEQVIGSTIKTKFELRDGKPLIVRLRAIDFVDDGPGKPVGIAKYIGRRPIMAFGNSDGDLQMLQYTTGSPGARFGLIVHHTDGEREYAYDRKSAVGKLAKAMDAAQVNNWVVVSMKEDWNAIFPPQP
jgi:phosphoserine phosphatase